MRSGGARPLRSNEPLRGFMLKHTRGNDPELFTRMARVETVDSAEQLPLRW